MGAGCFESIALLLLLLGAGTVSLGLRGLSRPEGLPFGLGLYVRGAAGKFLGVLLVLLGVAMTAPFAWLLLRAWLPAAWQ